MINFNPVRNFQLSGNYSYSRNKVDIPALKFPAKDMVFFSGAEKTSRAEKSKQVISEKARQIEPGTFDGNGKIYIFVHGTDPNCFEKAGEDQKLYIDKWADELSKKGLHVRVGEYPSISKGEKIETSGKAVSKTVNEERVWVAIDKVITLDEIIGDKEKLAEHFRFVPTKGKKADSDTEKIMEMIPEKIKKVRNILEQNVNYQYTENGKTQTKKIFQDKEFIKRFKDGDMKGLVIKDSLTENFSTRIKKIQNGLAADIEKNTDFGKWDEKNRSILCKKAANNIMHSIVPKTILVGHSLGGFVNYIVGLNPKKGLEDKGDMTFDAGNGVSTIVAVSSPVAEGLKYPLPDVFQDAMYDNIEETFYKPFENTMWGGLYKFNPFYQAYKLMLKSTCNAITSIATNSFLPGIYEKHPGYKQVTEGEFVDKYLKGKNLPEGVSVLSYYHQLDKLVSPECAEFKENENCEDDFNKHSVGLDLDIDKEFRDFEEKKEPGITEGHIAHRLLAIKPDACNRAFGYKVITNPKWAEKLLNISNSDEVRHQCLKAIKKHLKENPDYLKETDKKSLRDKLMEVREERMPFVNSPSHFAGEILKNY